jgi:hypothetical protein
MTDFHTLQRDYEFALEELNQKTSAARLELAKYMLKYFDLHRHTLSIDRGGRMLVDGGLLWDRRVFRRESPLRETLLQIETAFEEGALPGRYNPCTLCEKEES